jgi:hypothetical protein
MTRNLSIVRADNFILFSFILAALIFTGRANYLLFHSLAELFSVIVAFCIFIYAWTARDMLEEHYILFLGIAYLNVGILDTLHLFTYKGMAILGDISANQPTQFWIASRYLESISLLTASLLLGRKIKIKTTLIAFLATTVLIILSIMVFKVFPDSYLESYITAHTDSQFTHGICPECSQRYQDEIDKNQG